MTASRSNAQALQERVAQRYRDRGYSVVNNPSSEEMPVDLGGYIPDIIATRDQEKLFIEVKMVGVSTPMDKYVDIAEEVKKNPPWRLLLVTERDIVDAGAETTNAILSWPDINKRATEAEALADQGSNAAVFLLAWSLIEAALRRRALSAGIPLERLPAAVLVRQLYSQGEIPASQYTTLLHLLQKRGAVAHGFDVRPTSLDVKMLLGVLREILNETRNE